MYKNWTVYVLECENDKYYVGKTKKLSTRILYHFNNFGSTWTKMHKPIKVLASFKNCDSFDEDKYTKFYMSKYGIDNVRGGAYSQLVLDPLVLELIKKEIWNAEDRCFKCGELGHFAVNCHIKPSQVILNNIDNTLRYDNKPHIMFFIIPVFIALTGVYYYFS